MEDISTTEALRRSGYGHRRTESSASTGTHVIFRLDTGEVVGHHTAFSAYETFCKPAGESR